MRYIRPVFMILLIGMSFANLKGNTGPVLFNAKPVSNQLFTRDQRDSARVLISGIVVDAGYDSVELECQKNDQHYNSYGIPLTYLNDKASFSFECFLHAELSTYDFSLYLIADGVKSQVWTAENIVCGDAYILTGQSNSHRAFASDSWQSNFCRTFGVKTGNSNYDMYDPADTLWALSHANSSTGPNVGSMGLAIQRMIMEEEGIPTCLFNGGTGGSNISEHLKSNTGPEDLNTIYGKLLYRIRKSGVTRIRAVLWHQGENDADLNPTLAYPERFSQLIHAWQEDFAPEAYYVYQLRPGGPGTAQGAFREMQRTLPDSLSGYNLELIATNGLPGYDGLHFNYDGYIAMANRTVNLIRTDFYNEPDIPMIHSPNIQKARYDHTKQQVILIFDKGQSMVWPDPVESHDMRDYFFLDGDWGMVSKGEILGDSVILTLKGPHFFDQITYLPDNSYHNSILVYQGPWLENVPGNSALSFYNFPVDHSDKYVKITSPNGGEIWTPGSEQVIQWVSTRVNTVRLDYNTDDGITWHLVSTGIPASSETFSWQIPALNSDQCRIRISDQSDTLIADESNNMFGIIEQSVTLLVPNGGEIYSAGDTVEILWTSSYVENVKLEYSSDGGLYWNTIRYRVEAPPGEYEWIAPDISSSQCLVRILDRDSDAADTSDAVFSIQGGNAVNPVMSPERFVLHPVYPNPFNPQTTLHFSLPEDCHVNLDVFDVKGNLVKTLADSPFTEGEYSFVWDASHLSSGIYLLSLRTDTRYATQKCVLMK